MIQLPTPFVFTFSKHGIRTVFVLTERVPHNLPMINTSKRHQANTFALCRFQIFIQLFPKRRINRQEQKYLVLSAHLPKIVGHLRKQNTVCRNDHTCFRIYSFDNLHQFRKLRVQQRLTADKHDLRKLYLFCQLQQVSFYLRNITKPPLCQRSQNTAPSTIQIAMVYDMDA